MMMMMMDMVIDTLRDRDKGWRFTVAFHTMFSKDLFSPYKTNQIPVNGGFCPVVDAVASTI